jgi:sterol desaturase/sphingolipid hydroxylase (fatty acid hydroxylase superfamily)
MMSTEDLLGLLIPAMFLGMLAIETMGTGRRWPDARLWRLKGLGFFVVLMTINIVLPSLLPDGLAAHSLLPGRRLGLAGGIIVGFLALTLATTLLHRAYHHFEILWRWVHQLHHSPPRLDVAGAVLFTPQEIVLNVLVFQLVEVVILGIDPLAAAAVGTVAAFYGMFQHFNIATPQWLGYLIQRPESHGVHHRRGFHAYNYADFPLWDLLMGTFRNPREYRGEVGFEGGAGLRIAPLLVGRDANAPLYGAASRGSAHPLENPA